MFLHKDLSSNQVELVSEPYFHGFGLQDYAEAQAMQGLSQFADGFFSGFVEFR